MTGELTEHWARRILVHAILEDRAAELLTALFTGGSVTIDNDGALVIVTAAQLDTLTGAFDWGDPS